MNAAVPRKTSSQQLVLPGTDASCDLSALNAHIAAELAAGLSSAAAVRERYGITDDQWATLRHSAVFRNMLGEAIRAWQGDLNAGARIQKKADIVLEDAIPAYDSMIHNETVPAPARIDAGKLLAQLAGRNQKSEGSPAAGGSGFVLNINMGGESKGITIEGKPLLDIVSE